MSNNEHQHEGTDVIDVEAYSEGNKDVPKGQSYKIRIDKKHYVVHVDHMTGRALLDLAEKAPPEKFRLDIKLKGGAAVKIELDQVVYFSTPGLERFITLPIEQTEGGQWQSKN